jgi:hypothetical protein
VHNNRKEDPERGVCDWHKCRGLNSVLLKSSKKTG